MMCEIDASFLYNTFGNGFCGLKTMGEMGYLVIFDTKHWVPQPGQGDISSMSEGIFVTALAGAAFAFGVASLCIETHQDTGIAPWEGPSRNQTGDKLALVWQLRDLFVLR